MKKQTLLHKHHIVPKHMGGSNDQSNIALLTPSEHAEAHRILFETYGKWQDYIAWQGLSKRMSNEEIIREKARLGNMGRTPWHKNKKIGPRSDITKQKISNTMRAKNIKPSPDTIAKGLEAAHKVLKGRKASQEECMKRSNALKLYNAKNPRPFRPRSENAKQKTSIKLQKPLTYKDQKYSSLKQCIEQNNTTRYWIVNDPSFKWI